MMLSGNGNNRYLGLERLFLYGFMAHIYQSIVGTRSVVTTTTTTTTTTITKTTSMAAAVAGAARLMIDAIIYVTCDFLFIVAFGHIKLRIR